MPEDCDLPLVSILIPAYNSAPWIAATLRSALAQTWPRKEIVVIDDGSKDETAAIARSFEPHGVRVVTKSNEGAAASRNVAFSLSRGAFIQWLDADDLLSPDKIEAQFRAVPRDAWGTTLFSCPWGYFTHDPTAARFQPTALSADLPAADWLCAKLGQNLHQQTATWLTPRGLAERAGAWDARLAVDDDGEYFARVLITAGATRFVPESRVYYRVVPGSRVSYIGASDRKMDAMLLSMKLHVSYLRSIEDSERTRRASLAYLHNWAPAFNPQRADIFRELEALAASLGGTFRPEILRAKYRWLAPMLGVERTWKLQVALPRTRERLELALAGMSARLTGARRDRLAAS
jgi:glycosyltransferase involved in cell wall biosynthesis